MAYVFRIAEQISVLQLRYHLPFGKKLKGTRFKAQGASQGSRLKVQAKAQEIKAQAHCFTDHYLVEKDFLILLSEVSVMPR